MAVVAYARPRDPAAGEVGVCGLAVLVAEGGQATGAVVAVTDKVLELLLTHVASRVVVPAPFVIPSG